MPRCKVLLFVVALDKFGPARAMVNLATRLDRNRFQVGVCYCEPNAYLPFLERLQDLAIPTYCLNMKGPFHIPAIFKLVSLLRKLHVDILHVRGVRVNFLGKIAARIAGSTRVLSNIVTPYSDHFQNQHGPLLGPLLFWVERISMRLSDYFVTNSHGVTMDLIQRLGVPHDKITCVHNGVDLHSSKIDGKHRQRIRAELGIPHDQLVIGTVSRLVHHKGIRYLIEAAVTVSKVHPNILILIVGDGDQRIFLQNYAAQVRLEKTVRFLGERDNVVEILSVMDIFVHPSLSEGSSNAVLEAMASGLPVVATAIAGMEELIEDNISGVLIPARSSEAIAQKILDLAKDQGRMKTLGNCARRKVEEMFTIEAMVHGFEQIYEDLLNIGQSSTARSRWVTG